jgi:mono/diheme cytochrome c family protein
LPEDLRYAPPNALQEAGRRIYAMHCARCHGENGNGDGKDATLYPPSPPSFLGMRPSYAIARQIIENGVPGTAMPSWPLLTREEIQAVTYYIRSLYSGGRTESSSAAGPKR